MGASTQSMGPTDVAILSAQAADAPLNIGAVCVFERGPLLDAHGEMRTADLHRHVEHRLRDLPRFHRRLVPVGLGQGPPMWVDEPDFDVADHLRNATLPPPGNRAQLRELVSRLLEEPLAADRSPWEIWQVDGLDDGNLAVVVKASHVLADGIALLDMALRLLDDERHPADDGAEGAEGEPPDAGARPPDAAELLVRTVVDRGRHRVGQLARVAVGLTRPRQLVSGAVEVVSGAAASLVVAPRLSVCRPVGSRRDIAWRQLPLADLLKVKRQQEVTLNDVVLAVVAGGLRTYLAQHGEPIDARPRVLVPVSIHGSAGDASANQFSMFVAGLPVTEADPVARLRAAHEEMVRAKGSHQTSLGSALFELGDLIPFGVLRRLVPAVIRRQPLVNLAVSNLPGTPTPLYLLGSRLLECYPFISVTGNIGLIVGVLSYDGSLGMCVTVDPDIVPDLDALVDAIEASAAELAAVGRRTARASRSPRAAARRPARAVGKARSPRARA